MAFTLLKKISGRKVYLLCDFETYHSDSSKKDEERTLTFVDLLPNMDEPMEGTTSVNDAITFKTYGQAADFKKMYRLSNWDIEFIPRPYVARKAPVKKESIVKIAKFLPFTV